MDERIKHKLLTYESDMQLDKEWQVLSQKMAPQKRRRILPFILWSAAAAVALVLVCVFVLKPFSGGVLPKEEIVNAETSTPTQEALPTTAPPSTQTEIEKATPDASVTSSTTNATTISNIAQNKVLNNSNEKKEQVNPGQKSESSTVINDILPSIQNNEAIAQNTSNKIDDSRQAAIATVTSQDVDHTKQDKTTPASGVLLQEEIAGLNTLSNKQYLSTKSAPKLDIVNGLPLDEITPTLVSCCPKRNFGVYASSSVLMPLNQQRTYDYPNELVSIKSIEQLSLSLGMSKYIAKRTRLELGYQNQVSRDQSQAQLKSFSIVNRSNVPIAQNGNVQLLGQAADIKINNTDINAYNAANTHLISLNLVQDIKLGNFWVEGNFGASMPVKNSYTYYDLTPQKTFSSRTINVAKTPQITSGISVTKQVPFTSQPLYFSLSAQAMFKSQSMLMSELPLQERNLSSISSYGNIETKSIYGGVGLKLAYRF